MIHGYRPFLSIIIPVINVDLVVIAGKSNRIIISLKPYTVLSVSVHHCNNQNYPMRQQHGQDRAAIINS